MNSSLYDLITYLEYGTKLHIVVIMFGTYGGKKLSLPNNHTIHSNDICNMIKEEYGVERCRRCRDAVIRLAIRRKKPFGGICINGIYEYTHPIIINDTVVGIIFIGNIKPINETKLNDTLIKHKALNLKESIESNFDYNKCHSIGSLIEDYILTVIEKFPERCHNTLVNNLKSYIDSNYEYNIDINLLAQIFHYNEKYLGRLFKKHTGISFCEYVNKRRISNAKQLLKTTDDRIERIATMVGFKNVTYFNRIFKKMIGSTPSDYRDSYQ